MRAEQPGRERLRGAAQLGPGQRDRPGGGLDGHLPVAVPGARPGIGAGRGPLVTVAAEELSDLGFEGGLHQQLGAEPGHLLQHLRQRTVLGEKFIDVVADTVSRRYSDRHGRGSFLRRLAGLEGKPTPVLSFTPAYSSRHSARSRSGISRLPHSRSSWGSGIAFESSAATVRRSALSGVTRDTGQTCRRGTVRPGLGSRRSLGRLRAGTVAIP